MKIRSLLALGVALFLVALYFGITTKREQGVSKEEDHIHAIAFDPTDAATMYIATHHTLLKRSDSQNTQVGEYGNDLMGLVVAADGSFYTSGHSTSIPDVGIRKSVDKGKSWQTLAYEEKIFITLW